MGEDSVDPPDPLAVTVGDTGHVPRTDDARDDGLDLEDSLLQAVAAAPPIPVHGPRLEAGTVVGEGFRIERVLGAGAMGVVYEARDLALDRRVALKLHASRDDDVRGSRMWREAKAMARLSHPHVIAVHEVGEHEGRVYIAMELVEGGTVRDWLRAAPQGFPRPWREVLRVFVQAAEGLAAAHAVELVHRDFKPDNILLGEDGRVRVADFGLARAATDEPEPAVRVPSSPGHSPSVTDRLTQTGAAVGTPAYMAPEQLSGLEVDHRCDQFSFCVALYEALYGQRPRPSRSFAELLEFATEGRVRPPPPGSSVPGWLHAVVLRGLRPDPADRFASMDALIAALRADPSRRRRRVVLGAGLVAALGLTAWVARATSGAEAPCRGMADPMTAQWNPQVAAEVAQALHGTGSPLAAAAIERVVPALNDYAAAWGRQRVEACEATRVRGEQSEALLDRRMACLERRRQQVEAVVDVLGAPDAEVVEHAVQALDALGSLEACADRAALQAQYPPPDVAIEEAVASAQARVAAIEAAAWAGHAATMVEPAEALVEQARALAYPPLRAEAHFARHLVAYLRAEYEPAIAEAVAAVRWATEVGDARTAWRAALAVARDVGRTARGTEDALRWLETAEGWGQRIELDVGDRSHASRVRAEVLQKGDRVDEALAELEGSLERLEAESPPAGALAGHYVGMAYLLRRMARLDEARTRARQGIEQLEARLGPGHPEVAKADSILAQIESGRGEASRALVAVERALSIWQAVHGERSVSYASTLRERGDVLTALGRLPEAIADYEHALRILEEVEHRDPGEELLTINNLANTLSDQGQTERAIELVERSLHRAIEAFGADSVKVAQIHLNFGSYLSQAGRHQEGLEQTRRAMVLLEQHFGPSHPHVGIARLNLALAAIELDHSAQAHEELARATAIFAEHYPPSHFWHARAARVEAALLESEERWPEAVAKWREAVALLEAALEPLNPDVVQARYKYGRVLVETGDPRAAVEPLREALRAGEQAGLTPVQIARTRYQLARALWANREQRPEALALLDQARPVLEREDPELARQARRWDPSAGSPRVTGAR